MKPKINDLEEAAPLDIQGPGQGASERRRAERSGDQRLGDRAMTVEQLIQILCSFKNKQLLVEFVPGGGGAWINVMDEDGELIATIEEDGSVGFSD